MARLTYTVLQLAMVWLLAGCSLFIQEPRVTLKETNLVGLSSSGIDVEFLVGVANPNSFDLTLLGFTYDLRVMALPMAAGNAHDPVAFPSGKETDIRLPIHLTYDSLLEVMKRQPNLEKLPYRLHANLHVKSPLGAMTIPVEKEDIIIVPDKYRPPAVVDRLRDMLRTIR